MENGPIKLEYVRPPAIETPPWRPAWLTILRAAGVAASGVAGVAVGYGLGIAAALSLVAIARAINLAGVFVSRAARRLVDDRGSGLTVLAPVGHRC